MKYSTSVALYLGAYIMGALSEAPAGTETTVRKDEYLSSIPPDSWTIQLRYRDRTHCYGISECISLLQIGQAAARADMAFQSGASAGKALTNRHKAGYTLAGKVDAE